MKFIRHASHRKVRVSSAWRRPKGLQNKMRLQKKGHRGPVKEGYMSAKATKFMKAGLIPVNVYTEADLEDLSPKHGVVLGKVGMKKKLSILKLCVERKLKVLNGDANTLIKELTAKFESSKKATEERAKEKEAKQEELKKKAEKTEKPEGSKLEDAVESEEKEAAEKKEKEKVLTKAR